MQDSIRVEVRSFATRLSGWLIWDVPEDEILDSATIKIYTCVPIAKDYGLFGFHRGVMVASRSQLGLPA